MGRLEEARGEYTAGQTSGGWDPPAGWSHWLFSYSSQAKTAFYLFKWLKKIKGKIRAVAEAIWSAKSRISSVGPFYRSLPAPGLDGS